MREITREQFSSKLRIDLKNSLQKLSEKTRIPQSKLLDEAIEDLLRKHGFKDEKEEAP